MSKVIKVRFWCPVGKKMHYTEIEEPCLHTGINDRYGTEIYNGDILRMTPLPPVLNPDEWVAAVEYIGSAFMADETLISDLPLDRIEVIGNIYQTPELLTCQK